jgi:uncharacterized repeat protein (TIGR02543 family)
MKRFSKILSLPFLLLVFGLMGCDDLDKEKYKLYEPSGFYYSDNTDVLRWMMTQGAVGYKIEIGDTVYPGQIQQNIDPQYNFSSFSGGYYTVRVKAIGSGNFTNSDWSQQYTFAKSHIIAFENNGGTGTSYVDPFKVKTGQSYSNLSGGLYAPEKEGYDFGGWYLTSDFSGDVVTNGTTVQKTDTTLYARWNVKGLAVTFDKQGGTGTAEGKPVNYDQQYGELPVLTKDGYAFGGWFTAINGSGDQITAETTVKTVSAITLYAYFVPRQYTVTLDVNGGNALEQTAHSVSYGQNYTLPVPARTGYSFYGWYDDQSEQKTSPSGNLTFSWSQPDDITLYANWNARRFDVEFTSGQPVTFTMSFDLNYTNAPAPTRQTITAFNSLVYPPIPVRNGYIFAGWYTEAACNTIASFTGTINSNKSFYAKWIQKLEPSNSNPDHDTTTQIENVALGSTKTFSYMEWGNISKDHSRLFAFVVLYNQTVTLTASRTSNTGAFLISVVGASGHGTTVDGCYSNSRIASNTFTHRFNSGVLVPGIIYYVKLEWKMLWNDTVPSLSFALSGTQIPQSGARIDAGLFTTRTATYNSTPPAVDVPINAGYEFKGYFTSDGEMVYDADMNYVYTPNGVWNYAPDNSIITLYAHWQ